jgi:hypothetical protein
MEWRLLHKFECYIVLLFPSVMQPGAGWWLESHNQNLHNPKYSEIVSRLILHWTKLVPRQKESWLCTLQEAITHENFLFSYWIVNFQMGNQITVTQMHFLSMVFSMLHSYYVHLKKSLITPLKKIHKGEQFIHIHMGLWIWLFHYKLSRFLRQN